MKNALFIVRSAAFVFGVFALFSATSVTAETIEQTRSNATNLGLYGGEVRDIAVDPDSSYIFASTYSPNGVFISSNNGETWRGLPAGTDYGEPQGVELDADGTVWMLLSEGLFKSADKGNTLTPVTAMPAQYGSSITAAANNDIYIGRSDGAVSVTRDGGASFTTVTLVSGAVIESIAASPTAGTAFAITSKNGEEALYKTTNRGSSWSLVDTSDISVPLGIVSVSPTNANTLIITSSQADQPAWGSLDGGSNWSALTVEPFATAITWDTTGRTYLGVDYFNGSSWETINPSTPASRVSGIVVPDPDDPNILYGGTFGAFAISTDRGATWTDANQGITAVTVKDIAQSTDKQTMWVATNAGLAKTTNFLSASPDWEFPIYYDVYPESVWINPADANHVVVGGYQSIVYTTNGGDSWSTATGWNSTYAVQDIVADPGNPDVLYAAGAYSNFTSDKTGGVYRSLNGGQTWSNLSFPGNAAAQSLAITTGGKLYVGTGLLTLNADSATGIYTYDDGTWTKLTDSPNEEIPALAVDPNNQSIVYATAANFNTYGADGDTTSGFYRSTDGGSNWTRVTSGLSNATALRSIAVQDTGSTTNVYIGGKNKLTSTGHVYKSTNSGQDWDVYYSGLKNESFNALLFDGLVTGNTRGLYDIRGKASFSLKTSKSKVVKGTKVTASVVLKDSATGKKLKSKKVKFYVKTGKKWVLKKTVKTDKKGVAKVKITATKKMQVKASWTPAKADKEEYTKSTSKIKKVTVTKKKK